MATAKKPPTHGVGGGVVSAKPAARGGRSSELHVPYIGEHGASSKLASYLKRSVTAKPGKRVK